MRERVSLQRTCIQRNARKANHKQQVRSARFDLLPRSDGPKTRGRAFTFEMGISISRSVGSRCLSDLFTSSQRISPSHEIGAQAWRRTRATEIFSKTCQTVAVRENKEITCNEKDSFMSLYYQNVCNQMTFFWSNSFALRSQLSTRPTSKLFSNRNYFNSSYFIAFGVRSSAFTTVTLGFSNNLRAMR